VGKSDPTKDPEFQKVVRHFVTTPPKPHSEMKVNKKMNPHYTHYPHCDSIIIFLWNKSGMDGRGRLLLINVAPC
jgi:hypothetical protein